MTYIRQIAGQAEKILVVTRPHWIYFFEALLWLISLPLMGFVIDYILYMYYGATEIGFYSDIPYLHPKIATYIIPIIFAFSGLAIFITLALIYFSAEIGLTEERIIYKKGLFFVEVDHIDLDDVRAEHVYHGWFGWLLHYGKIRIDCRFIGDVWLPAIPHPYKFIKGMHVARAKNPKMQYGADELNTNLQKIRVHENQANILRAKTKEIFAKAANHKFLRWNGAS